MSLQNDRLKRMRVFKKSINYFLQRYFHQKTTEAQKRKLFLMRQIAYCYLAIHFLDHAATEGLNLAREYAMETVPAIHEWIDGYDAGRYRLESGEDFLLFAMVKIKASSFRN